MKKLLLPLAFALAAPVMPVHADSPRNAQDKAREDLRAGKIKPIRSIENVVIPAMGGAQYLGFEYDPVAMAYRLKFIRDGRVIFVDVDARSGDVIRKLQ
ncbi:MAG TPA: hypothetical protein PK680_10805 [Novosphingobium sp.]|nr:hypothetical protein [Novosphingobium sp.]HQA18859.1 hypothetical protein [Novosphingobium sp.]